MLGKGYVHVYTGNGKGKTSAALGLALRACGAGLTVYIAQFLKSRDYSELKSLARFSGQITVRQCGTGRFVKGRPSDEDRGAALQGFKEARQAIHSGHYQMVILDEINVALSYGIFQVEDVLDLIRSKPDGLELILTGRRAHPSVVDAADLVTEMLEVKHYYVNGIEARRGVEK